MTTSKNSVFSRRLAQGIMVLTLLMAGFGLVLSRGYSEWQGGYLREPLGAIGAAAYSIIGVLILTRHPRHMVGRLFLIVGFFSALGNLHTGLIAVLDVGFIRDLSLWAGHIAWVPEILIPISLVLLYFPDGRLPSARWRVVPLLTILGIGGLVASYAFHPWPWEAGGIDDPHNPLAIPSSESFFELVFFLSPILLVPGVIGSLAAVVYRFRRAKGVERVQIKWVVYTAVIAFSPLLFLSLPFFILNIGFDSPIFILYFVSLPTILASVIGIAILRYRLYDIDIIIRRTLVYGVLTLLLVGVYFGSVVLLTQAFRALTGQDSPVAIVISTLIIAAIFNPLRLRVQEAIDRRFYRRKYDAQQALADFAATARDEVEMEQLTGQLLSVVQETMQPEQASLWLRHQSDQAIMNRNME